MSDIDQMTANDTKVFKMCNSLSCLNRAVGGHGFCGKHKTAGMPTAQPTPQKGEEPRLHKLGCDEMHGHVAPKCCSPNCWCFPLRNFEKNPNNALTRWEATSKNLTVDQKERITNFIYGMEKCLKFGSGRMYLGLEANMMLAWEFYKVDNTETPPKPKGRRDAIEHTRKMNEEN